VTAAIFTDPALGAALAVRYSTRCVIAFYHSVTDAGGFWVHSPDGTRSVLVDQEGVVEEGKSILGEEPYDLEEFNEYSVLGALELLGLDLLDGVEASTRCALLRLAT
jgi:hypothetical protein